MTIKILRGDALQTLKGLESESVHCCVTSPPYYGLRCYGTEGQIGLEETPEQHIAALVEVFREVRRVLRADGCLFLNYGDCYLAQQGAGYPGFGGRNVAADPALKAIKRPSWLKPKDLMMMPSRVALALQQDGWWLRSMMPWLKRSAMPESVTDRPATAIEYVFLLTKSARYFWDGEAVRQKAEYGRSIDPTNTIYDGIGFNAKRSHGARSHSYEGGRNFRNSDLFYASLEPPHGLISGEEPLALDVNPAGYAESHFATFPPKLIEPLIKAGTSERGCCPDCGAPWVREVERTAATVLSPNSEYGNGAGRNDGNRSQLVGAGSKTLGWSPSCACKVEPAYPCTVLDPFLGAGTTALVADRLGRNCIGIELNPEYADMAARRIKSDAGMFAEVL